MILEKKMTNIHTLATITAVPLTTAQEDGHRRARITLAMNVSSFGSSRGVRGGQRKCLTWCWLLIILIIEDLTPHVDTG